MVESMKLFSLSHNHVSCSCSISEATSSGERLSRFLGVLLGILTLGTGLRAGDADSDHVYGLRGTPLGGDCSRSSPGISAPSPGSMSPPASEWGAKLL